MSTTVRRILACALALWVAQSVVMGWGFDAHRYVTDRAIDLLPPPIRPFFDSRRAFITEHAVDPDLWRTAGFVNEAPRHFLNLDAYGSAPFAALPRTREDAIRRFGEAVVTERGLLPWRTVEFFDRLASAFDRYNQRPSGGSLNDVAFYAAVLSHYVADAHVPLHAVLNYDGQLTGQRGVHARFETELFYRHRSELAWPSEAPAPIADPLGAIFDILIASEAAAAAVLEADRQADGAATRYDDRYFARFWTAVGPVFERRIGEASGALAAFVTGAWEAGGRPRLPGGSRAAGGAEPGGAH